MASRYGYLDGISLKVAGNSYLHIGADHIDILKHSIRCLPSPESDLVFFCHGGRSYGPLGNTVERMPGEYSAADLNNTENEEQKKRQDQSCLNQALAPCELVLMWFVFFHHPRSNCSPKNRLVSSAYPVADALTVVGRSSKPSVLIIRPKKNGGSVSALTSRK